MDITADNGHDPDGDGDDEVNITNELIFTALIEGHSQRYAAAFADVSTKTVSRRLKDPGFVDELNRRKRARSSELADQMRSAMPLAVETVVECLGEIRSSIQLRAAQIILTHFTKLLEAHDVDERMFELEQSIAELRKRPASRLPHES